MLLLLLALAADPTPAPATPAAPPAVPAAPAKDKMVCRTVGDSDTGTRLRAPQVCHRKSEWAAIDAEAERNADAFSRSQAGH